MSPARFIRALFLLLLIFLLSPAVNAQITGVSTPVQAVGHDYIKMLNESVNPANGSVSINIQAPVPPGRRLTLPFSFNYNSSGTYTPQGTGGGGAYMQATDLYLNQDGWSYGIPLASSVFVSHTPVGQPTCYAWTGYAFIDSAGTQYSFSSLIGYESAPRICTGYNSVTSQTLDFYSATLGSESNSYPLNVTSLDNTTYTFNTGGGCAVTNGGPSSAPPSTIEDRNGNIITITETSCTGSFTATDTLGRTVLSSSGFGKTGNTITVPGLAEPYTLTWGTVSPTYSPGSTRVATDGWCNTGFSGPGGGAIPVVTAISLPNGQEYTFTYDPVYGLLTKMTYPNGGYISYTWGLNTRSDFAAVEDSNGAPQQCDFTYDTPALTHRYVSFDGSAIAEQQDFTNYTTTWNPNNYAVWTTKTVTVTTHDLINGTSFQTNYTYSPVTVATGGSSWLPTRFGTQAPVEQQIVYDGTSGSTLRTVNKTWYDQFEIKTDQTVLDSGQTSQVNFTWSGGLITEKDEYDFTSTLQRKTTYTYGGGFNQPCKAIVYDGGGNRFSETDTYFDGSATLCSPGTTSTASVSNLPPGTHDGTNYAPTSTTERGNATTVTKQCFQSSTACASGNVVTSFTYDETGQALTSTDPNGHITQFSYADNYTELSGGANVSYTPTYNTNAFLTKITNPLGQTQNSTYDYNNGQLTISKDQNGLVTTFVYNDSLSRPTSATRPDSGQTTISYNDTSHTVTTSKQINSSLTITTIALSDGVGHVKETQLTSDPQGTVYTDTTYDGLGRVRTVSNPYRSGSDPTTTAGTTTYFYDALSRKCLEVPPDGTLPTGNVCSSTQPANDLFMAYSGSTTTVTDQTGRSRASVLDGLGRLMQVFENPTGLNYETDYTYDPLNDLLSVNQKGGSTNSSLWRTRTFVYDSLARLVTSTNPEAGTITYKYDSDANCASPNSFIGLLVSKTDARGIRTCAQYDAINREAILNYSNGDPTVTTTYDQANCLGLSSCQNIGYRTSMTDAAGSEIWSYQVDATNHRSVHVDQRTTASGSNNITKTATFYLDLSGNVTQAVYPTGRVVNYTYNAADRPINAADGSNGITYATDFQTAPTGCLSGAVCYTPQGTFYALSVGQSSSFTGLNISHTYNVRLQPNEFKASSSAGSAIDITYSYADPLNGNHNAGHVFSITNNLNSSRTQTFTYDQLNRITSAGTSATSGTYCWGYLYTLDAWANLLSQAGWSPNYNGCSEATMGSVTANGNNQISGFTYDASGNTQNDGTIAYLYNAESQMKTANGVTYAYDGDGRRVYKSNGKLYWYGAGGDILAETDGSGNTLNEYIFFGGKRVAMLPTGGNPIYYVEDMLGTSRLITQNNGTVCYDADFDPYGGEHAYTNTCPQNYKFEGKERDTETGNDDFGARYYTSRFGRWLSADWSNVPIPVPYANLTNPQTLNLYSMVADDPESFADLDGHTSTQTYQLANPAASSAWDPTFASSDNGLFSGNDTPQDLKLEDVINIIQQVKKGSADPVTMGMSIFNSLGNNVRVSGDIMRQALNDTGIKLEGAGADLISHAQSISKAASTVTILSSAEYSTKQGANTLYIDKKVSFNVGTSGGLPALTDIKGLSADTAKHPGVTINQIAVAMHVYTKKDNVQGVPLGVPIRSLAVTGSKAWVFSGTDYTPLQ